MARIKIPLSRKQRLNSAIKEFDNSLRSRISNGKAKRRKSIQDFDKKLRGNRPQNNSALAIAMRGFNSDMKKKISSKKSGMRSSAVKQRVTVKRGMNKLTNRIQDFFS